MGKILFWVSFSIAIMTNSQAQDLADFKIVNKFIGEDQINKYVKNPHKEGIPGPFFTALISEENNCLSENIEGKQEDKNVHYEIVLIAQGSSQATKSSTSGAAGLYVGYENYSGNLYPVQNLIREYQNSETDLIKLSEKVWSAMPENQPQEYYSSEDISSSFIEHYGYQAGGGQVHISEAPLFDKNSDLGRGIFVETLILKAPTHNISETGLAKSIASEIANFYKTEEERYNALSTLSSRLYNNYNNSRNPGHNNSRNNPDGMEIPKSDMSLKEILMAAGKSNVYSGGVCNDISENVAIIGKYLFPDKDVLTITGGTHFGVILADDKGTMVIDGPDQTSLQNRLTIDADYPVTNVRVSKVEDGHLKEIAKVNTQMGQLAESVFQTDQKLINTDAKISSLVTQFIKTKDITSNKIKKNTFAGGLGNLANGKAIMVVAKFETIKHSKNHGYIGVGAGFQKFDNDIFGGSYQIHTRAGFEKTLIHYVDPKAKLNFDFKSGVHSEVMASPKNGIRSIAGGLDWNNKITFGVKPGDGKVDISGNLQATHTLGSKSWGNTSGAISKLSGQGLLQLIENLNFHLNQVSSDINVTVPVSSKSASVSKVQYQGTNIGQSLSLLSGIEINAPKGAQLMFFVGFETNKLKGFKTQHSLLVGNPQGGQTGIKVKKNNIELNGSVGGIGGKQGTTGNIDLKVPLYKSKKKVKSPEK